MSKTLSINITLPVSEENSGLFTVVALANGWTPGYQGVTGQEEKTRTVPTTKYRMKTRDLHDDTGAVVGSEEYREEYIENVEEVYSEPTHEELDAERFLEEIKLKEDFTNYTINETKKSILYQFGMQGAGIAEQAIKDIKENLVVDISIS